MNQSGRNTACVVRHDLAVDVMDDDKHTSNLSFPRRKTPQHKAPPSHESIDSEHDDFHKIGHSILNFSWKNVVSKTFSRNAVLLLFSLDGCRFELLALQEIDEKATVSDIFQHVSNCQDEFLQRQTYKGVLVAATERLVTMDKVVANHCGKRNSILVAVPEESTVIECTRNAIQLLSDPLIDHSVSEKH